MKQQQATHAPFRLHEAFQDPEMRAAYGDIACRYAMAATLVAARTMHHMTQADLASLAGVSQAYIAKLERGEANPSIGQIGAMLARMGVRARFELLPLADDEGAPQEPTHREEL